MTITKEQLKYAADCATKLKRLRDVRTLTDMQRSIKKYGSLTSRQTIYAQTLIEKNSDKAIKESFHADEVWRKEWEGDPDLREKADIVASYYLTTVYYALEAKGVRAVLDHPDQGNKLPSRQKIKRMVANKYADNVWQSHKGEQKWKVGNMVAIRKSYKGNLELGNKIETRDWAAQNNGNPMFDELSYMVVEVNSKPIDQAYTYDAKRGGCRYYRLLPVGVPTAVHIMECNLKKVLKKKVTK